MEVEGLGARCGLASCRTLDYLPYTCPSCSLQFCQHHRLPKSHACRASRPTVVPTCPVCSAPVPVPHGLSVDGAIARHIDAGCPKRERNNPRCALPSCNVRDPAATACVACRRVFCLAHCLEVNHDCEAVKTRTNSAKNGVFGGGKGVVAVPKRKANRPTTASNPSNKNKSASKTGGVGRGDTRPGALGSETARGGAGVCRVDFLNAASAPVGDAKIEAEDRFQVGVLFPAGSGIAGRHVWLSVKHSPGKVVDSLHKLVPELTAAPSGQRYAVFAVRRDLSGVNLLPYVTPLRELKHVVSPGDMLVLQVGDESLDGGWLAALSAQRSSKLASPFGRMSVRGSGGLRGASRCAVS